MAKISEDNAWEFCRKLGKLDAELQKKWQGVIMVNVEQMQKFTDLCEFLKRYVGEPQIDLNPNNINGYVTVEAITVDLWGDIMGEFKRHIQNVDVFGIYHLTNGKVELDFNVNDVFQRITLTL